MTKMVSVVNLRGEEEPFSRKKVEKSARRAGASSRLANKIADIVESEIYPGIKTDMIYHRVKELLKKKNSAASLKSSIKEAMKELGPTGFPFEKYIGEILSQSGFSVKLNQFISGRCVPNYEIDFLAQKDNLVYIGECKYRNSPGDRVHTGDILANQARFEDILKGEFFNKKIYQGKSIKTMVVTNTKFTSRAKKYALCRSVELLGWRYPENKGLEYLIETKKLYPITILHSLRAKIRDALVSERVMLASEVLRIDRDRFCGKFDIKRDKLDPIIKEAEVLLER